MPCSWARFIISGLGRRYQSQNISYLYDPKHKEEDKERDTMGKFKIVYDFPKPVSWKEAYAADITYGTNNEYGFDYLRDNLVTTPADLVQRCGQ